MTEKEGIQTGIADYILFVIALVVQFLIGWIFYQPFERIFSHATALFQPLLVLIVYSLYSGNKKLSFLFGFLSSIVPFMFYVFVQKVFIGQDILIWVGLGILYGIIGVLLAVLHRKTDIKPVFWIPITLISIFGVPVIFGLQYFGSFIISLASGIIFAYSVSHNLRNSILFIYSALLLVFFTAIKIIPDEFFFYNLIIYTAVSCIIGITAVILGIFLLERYRYLKNQLR